MKNPYDVYNDNRAYFGFIEGVNTAVKELLDVNCADVPNEECSKWNSCGNCRINVIQKRAKQIKEEIRDDRFRHLFNEE